VGGAHAWQRIDLGGAQLKRSLLEQAQQKLREARQATTKLPALRLAAANAPVLRDATNWTSADDLRAVSQLAGKHGVELLTLEPQPPAGAGIAATRPLRFTARADFAEWLGFLRGLSSLPTLVAPGDLTIKRQGDLLMINATLDSFPALRPVFAQRAGESAAEADDDYLFFDPFSPLNRPAISEDASLRLVGVLRNSFHGLALVETNGGVTAVAVGDQLGIEQVTRIDAPGVGLSGNGRTRTLMFGEVAS
jgi:Tfp pilus assembly protein PilO